MTIHIKSPEDFGLIGIKNMHKDDNITEMDDKKLVGAHVEAHRAYAALERFGSFGDWTKDEIISYHNKVVAEMKKRGMQHNSPLGETVKESSDIQTLIFDKSKFSREQALAWAKSHGFKAETSRETENTWRVRQFPPEKCAGSGGLKELSEGVRAYICPLPSTLSKKVYVDLGENLKDGKFMPAYDIILQTDGCEWGKCDFCTFSKEKRTNFRSVVLQAKEAFGRPEFRKMQDKEFMVMYHFGGSWYNELTQDERDQLIKLAKQHGASALHIECLPHHVTFEKVKSDVNKIYTIVCLELETADDQVRSQANHIVKWNDFEKAVKVIRNAGAQVSCFLMLRYPYLDEKQGIQDVCNSIDKVADLVDSIRFYPVFIPANTPLFERYLQREYRPPWIWSSFYVIKYCKLNHPNLVFHFRETRQRRKLTYTHNCGACDDDAIGALLEFNKTQDLDAVLEKYPKTTTCTCLLEWLDEVKNAIDPKLLWFDPDQIRAKNATTLPSGKQQGELIKLEDIVQKFEDFTISKPFISLTGGIVNNSETTGDIDILINGKEDDPDVQKAVFRISRMFKEPLRSRLHFLFATDFNGPFTSYYPLYNEKIERIEQSEVVELAGKFIKPLKAGVRAEREIFKAEDVKKEIPEKSFPLAVQVKYDGLRGQIHKNEDQVLVFSDDGKLIGKQLPKLVEAVKKLPDCVLDCEIEQWIDGKHIGREVIAGKTHQSEPFDDTGVVANIFDIMEWEGDDITKKPYSERLSILQNLGIAQSELTSPKEPLNIAPSLIANNYSELEQHIEKIFNLQYSEGAMVKALSSIYEKDGITRNWWKVKKYAEVHACVLEKIETKTPDVYNYYIGLLIPEGVKVNEDKIVKVKDKNIIRCGKTFNTKRKLSEGDVVTVSFHTLFYYKKDGIVDIGIYEPKIMEKRPIEIEPDDINEAVTIAKKAGLLQTKEQLNIGAIAICGEERLSASAPAREFYKSERIQQFVKKCEEEKIPCYILSLEKGVLSPDTIVEPYESSEPNWDLAVELMKKVDLDVLLFYDPLSKLDFHAKLSTIDRPKVYVVNELDALVEMFNSLERQEARLTNELMITPDENKTWKATLHSHYRGKSAHFDLRLERPDDLIGWTIFAAPKGEIKESVDTISEAKEADKKVKWKFGNSIKAQCTPKSPEPKEWLNYEKVVLPGGVGATAEEHGVFSIFDKGTVEYLAQKTYMHEYWLHMNKYKGRFLCRQLKNPYGDKPRFIWFCWFPADQTPYVLSNRSISAGYHTKIGRSELPKHIRDKIPDKYKYWKISSSKGAFEARKLLIQAIKRKEVHLSTGKYAIVHHYWKGPSPIREGPTEQHYDLYIKEPGSKKVQHFVLSNNIINSESTSGYLEKPADIKFLTIGEKEPESIKPGTVENPTKATPCFMKQLKAGKAIIYEDEPLLKKIDLEGVGLLLFTKEKGANMWNVSKTRTLSRLTLSRIPEGVALSPGVWNGFYYPPEVIKASQHKIEHVPIDVEHKEGMIVGETGSAKMKGQDLVVSLNIFDEEYKDPAGCYGLSIDAIIDVDRVRKIVKKIIEYKRLSLVKNPACGVCVIKGDSNDA